MYIVFTKGDLFYFHLQRKQCTHVFYDDNVKLAEDRIFGIMIPILINNSAFVKIYMYCLY